MLDNLCRLLRRLVPRELRLRIAVLRRELRDRRANLRFSETTGTMRIEGTRQIVRPTGVTIEPLPISVHRVQTIPECQVLAFEVDRGRKIRRARR